MLASCRENAACLHVERALVMRGERTLQKEGFLTGGMWHPLGERVEIRVGV